MKPIVQGPSEEVETERLADFVVFTQRSCILNLSSELNKANVSYPQFFLLAYLSHEEYLTMSAIARKTGHAAAAARVMVDHLVSLSYVERLRATDDRRKIMVRIAPKGIEMVAKMRKEIANDLVGILAAMDDVEAPSPPPQTDPPIDVPGALIPTANPLAPAEAPAGGDLNGLLETLDERERGIIDLRFGLTGRPPVTLEEAGRQFGVSRERIRQLQDSALAKMCNALRGSDPQRLSISNRNWVEA